jgi:ankyrin repeat protein
MAYSLLETAVWNKDIEKVKQLLAAGVDPNIRDKDGYALLHRCSNPTIVTLLIKAGANVNIQNNERFTPLHCCDDPEIMAILLQAGAIPNIQTIYGSTPLILCANSTIATLLLKAGADPKLPDKAGITPLVWCTHKIDKVQMRKLRMEYYQTKASLRSQCIYKIQTTSGLFLDILPSHIRDEIHYDEI